MEAGSVRRPGRIRRRIASGIVALIPIVVTVAVLRFVFNLSAAYLLPVVDPVVGNWPAAARIALALGVLLLGLYLLGEFATNFFGRRVLQLGESVVLRVPFVKVVYRASKQVVAALQLREGKAFKSVVFVEFPRPGMRAVGFVTGELTDLGGAELITVFVPTTPNPTTGFLQIVPKSAVQETDYSVEEGIKMVMSLGALLPEAGVPAHA